jgi:hypothetical protein
MDVYGQLQARTPRIDIETNMSALRRLWGAKLLLHAKEYAQGVKLMGGKRVGNANAGELCSNARIAYRWITSESTAPASFIWVCELFNLDPERIRLRIFHNWRGLLVSANPRLSNKNKAKLFALGEQDESSEDEES